MNEIKTMLKQKLDDCYASHKAEWLMMSPTELIEHGEEISTETWLTNVLPDAISDADARYLIRFKDPLEVMRDAWLLDNGHELVSSDLTLQQIVWDIADRGYADVDYELNGTDASVGEKQKSRGDER